MAFLFLLLNTFYLLHSSYYYYPPPYDSSPPLLPLPLPLCLRVETVREGVRTVRRTESVLVSSGGENHFSPTLTWMNASIRRVQVGYWWHVWPPSAPMPAVLGSRCEGPHNALFQAKSTAEECHVGGCCDLFNVSWHPFPAPIGDGRNGSGWWTLALKGTSHGASYPEPETGPSPQPLATPGSQIRARWT